MRLLHYSTDEITSLYSTVPRLKPNMKPGGLWVSVEGEDDWKSWCEGEDFRTETLNRYVYEVKLKEDAKILYLTSAHEIDKFTTMYSITGSINGTKFPDSPGNTFSHTYDIDWPQLASEGYQGIVIAPYCWERRMANHTFWYYSWDCASGCIWNPEAVEELIMVQGVNKNPALYEMNEKVGF